MARKAKDSPLAEITIRKYEPPSVDDPRELVRKLCLSLGLLQPGDSRDVIVDVLHVMLTKKGPLTSKEIEHEVIDAREAAGLPQLGVAPSNIRRQVLRLRDAFIVEKVGTTYRLRENTSLSKIFKEHVETYYLKSILERVKEYLAAADKKFSLS